MLRGNVGAVLAKAGQGLPIKHHDTLVELVNAAPRKSEEERESLCVAVATILKYGPLVGIGTSGLHQAMVFPEVLYHLVANRSWPIQLAEEDQQIAIRIAILLFLLDHKPGGPTVHRSSFPADY